MQLSADVKNSLEEATRAYHAQIDAAAAYLAGRGISRETASMFRLGYVAEPMIGHEQYGQRLAIAYTTPTGVVDLRFRALVDDGSPKYLSRPGAEATLFNVPAFTVDTDVIAVCEGEMDTMITHSECGLPAVGVPGAKNWKDWWSRAFADYRKVIVLCDGDPAGKEMGKRIAQQIDVATVVHMPEGMDVNAVFLQEGAEGIRKRVGL